jgi:glycerophosphoryl diester phosphodiesterase
VKKSQFEWLFDRPIAHRGMHDQIAPENSMPAFENAIRHGFHIEIDVHVTKDGVVVVHHDDSLMRMCGVNKKIKNCTLQEIKSFRLKGTECTIPTLQELLDVIDGKVGLLVEIKGLNPYGLRITKETLKVLSTYKGNVALQSFNYGAVRHVRRDGKYAAGQLTSWRGPGGRLQFWGSDFMGKLTVCKLSKPDFIAYDTACLPNNKYIVKARLTTPVITWTVKTKADLAIANEFADNIIFENAEELGLI